ncbi:hypothetical protein J6590_059043 [Homalodisca vitripennis]|nr:hypothetical protein J6590_059043 [Homalodisca vitripennis]
MIARGLIGDYTNRMRSLPNTPLSRKSKIRPSLKPEHIMKKTNIRRRCVECAKNKVETRTNCICAQIKSEMFLDDEISDLEDTSDIDVPELDSDVSLEDYSSGSGEVKFQTLKTESSEVDISHHTVNNSDSDEDDTPNPNRPIQEFSNPVWLRTYTPEDVIDIESQ